ncbi:MAG: V-type ATPase subunit [Proteocatella sp.]
MGNASKYSALNTKIQAMNSKLLTAKDYETLMNFTSEKEIGNYLKHNTRYLQVFKDYSIDKIKRWEFELILKKQMLIEMEKLSKYLYYDSKKFADILFMRAEVEDIKLILRAISRKEDLSELPEHFLHDSRFERVSFDKLLNQNSLLGLVEEFKGTVYEDAFRSITEEDLKLREFHAEMNLDSIYFRELRKKAEKLSKEDRSILESVIGINIDLINIQWIYRAIKYYNLMNEEIFNYTLLGGARLSLNKIKEIIYSGDVMNKVVDFMKNYGITLNLMDDKFLQVSINRCLMESIDNSNRRNPLTIARLIKYMHDAEFEAMDIITILEGIRYQNKDINKLLIKRW